MQAIYSRRHELYYEIENSESGTRHSAVYHVTGDGVSKREFKTVIERENSGREGPKYFIYRE